MLPLVHALCRIWRTQSSSSCRGFRRSVFAMSKSVPSSPPPRSSLTTRTQDINRLIPRSEMDLLRAALESAVASADDRFESTILGSYRRGVPFSSDIDLVIRHELFVDANDAEVSKPMMFKIIESMKENGLVKDEDALTHGPKKYSVRSSTDRNCSTDSDRAGIDQTPRPSVLPADRRPSRALPLLPLHAARL